MPFDYYLCVTMNRIKEVLKDQGRSQTWLANQIGKSYVVVTNYCNNKSQPNIRTLGKIALFLKVDIRDLLNSTNPSEG
jgi:putative transcriptional regulator